MYTVQYDVLLDFEQCFLATRSRCSLPDSKSGWSARASCAMRFEFPLCDSTRCLSIETCSQWICRPHCRRSFLCAYFLQIVFFNMFAIGILLRSCSVFVFYKLSDTRSILIGLTCAPSPRPCATWFRRFASRASAASPASGALRGSATL